MHITKVSHIPNSTVQIPPGELVSLSTHIVELGLVIGKGGRDISQANADSHIAGYGKVSFPAFYDNVD